jgi:hypothetical protein
MASTLSYMHGYQNWHTGLDMTVLPWSFTLHFGQVMSNVYCAKILTGLQVQPEFPRNCIHLPNSRR